MSTPGYIINGDGETSDLRGSAGDDAFSGSNLGETFYTGLGDDTVYASGGDDTVYADLGRDFLDGGSGVDTLTFASVNSTGAIESSFEPVVIDLQKHAQNLGYWGTKTIYHFENVVGGDGNDVISGDGGANVVRGNGGNDKVFGRGGADYLTGDYGNDTLDGSSGNDELIGNAGKDKLYGGSGADVLRGFENPVSSFNDADRDTFIYKSISESGKTAASRDTIWGNFNASYDDKIDLSAIDADGNLKSENGTFVWIGSGAFHATSTGEVRVTETANSGQYQGEYLLEIDTDKDTSAEMTMLVHVDRSGGSGALDQTDFLF